MRNEPLSTRLDPMRERDLIMRAPADGAAFGELYDHYAPRLYAFIVRRVGERSVAEAMTATTFEQAVTAIAGPDFKAASFAGLLYRSAVGAILEHASSEPEPAPTTKPGKARTGSKGAGAATVAARGTGEEVALGTFAAALEWPELAQALRRVPENHRQVLTLRFYDGLEVDEICGLLGCSRATFAGKLNRALGALRSALLKEATDAA